MNVYVFVFSFLFNQKKIIWAFFCPKTKKKRNGRGFRCRNETVASSMAHAGSLFSGFYTFSEIQWVLFFDIVFSFCFLILVEHILELKFLWITFCSVQFCTCVCSSHCPIVYTRDQLLAFWSTTIQFKLNGSMSRTRCRKLVIIWHHKWRWTYRPTILSIIIFPKCWICWQLLPTIK